MVTNDTQNPAFPTYFELKAQRDELLEALKRARGYVKSCTEISVFALDELRRVDEVIARAEGRHDG